VEISQLQAFIAVAQQQSFSLAANQLHLTQPAISKRISALEQSCNAKLFHRIGHQIRLTEAGERLLPEAQSIIKRIEYAKERIQTLSDQVSGKLSMATSHHIGLHRLPKILKRYAQRYPKVQLDLEFIESEQAIESIKSGTTEIAVITLPLNRDPKIDFIPLWQDELVVVVNPEHPLAEVKTKATTNTKGVNKNKGNISLEELAEYPMLLPAEHTYTREIIQQPFIKQGLNLQIAMNTHDLESLKMLVGIGLGWSLLPKIMLDDKLQVLNANELQLERRLGVIKHIERKLSSSAQAMCDLLLNQNS
jgi:DNA-binding transcriptional LysR family regulator